MENQNMMSRRTLMKSAACGLGLAAVAAGGVATGAPPAEDNKQLIKFNNAELYGADGSFQVDKAKKAILRPLKYPVYTASDGGPNGVLMLTASVSSRRKGSYIPVPPIIPSSTFGS